MAWSEVKINTGKTEYTGQQRGDDFEIPFASGLKVGDSFKVGAEDHKVINITSSPQPHLQTYTIWNKKRKNVVSMIDVM